jgi:hypothetical protein
MDVFQWLAGMPSSATSSEPRPTPRCESCSEAVTHESSVRPIKEEAEDEDENEDEGCRQG